MGWIGDTFRAMLGFDEEERAFRDSLAAAERRAHWGSSGENQNDFIECLHLLANCPADKSPNAHYSYRLHRAAATAHAGMARHIIGALQGRTRQLEEYFKNLEEGRDRLLTQAETMRARVAEMEAEGSLISAREERRRLEEMERETRDMPELAAEKISKGSSATAELHPLYRRHREAAEKSLLAMRAIKGLAGEDADICAKLAAKIEKDLTAADSQWKAIESRLKELLGPSQQEKQQ